jgi:hypothetical protein
MLGCGEGEAGVRPIEAQRIVSTDSRKILARRGARRAVPLLIASAGMRGGRARVCLLPAVVLALASATATAWA